MALRQVVVPYRCDCDIIPCVDVVICLDPIWAYRTVSGYPFIFGSVTVVNRVQTRVNRNCCTTSRFSREYCEYTVQFDDVQLLADPIGGLTYVVESDDTVSISTETCLVQSLVDNETTIGNLCEAVADCGFLKTEDLCAEIVACGAVIDTDLCAAIVECGAVLEPDLCEAVEDCGFIKTEDLCTAVTACGFGEEGIGITSVVDDGTVEGCNVLGVGSSIRHLYIDGNVLAVQAAPEHMARTYDSAGLNAAYNQPLVISGSSVITPSITMSILPLSCRPQRAMITVDAALAMDVKAGWKGDYILQISIDFDGNYVDQAAYVLHATVDRLETFQIHSTTVHEIDAGASLNLWWRLLVDVVDGMPDSELINYAYSARALAVTT